MATRLDHSREAKIDKRKQLEELGINVHPYTFAVSHSITQAKESIGARVTCAGRIMAIREHGKVTFATLRDNSSEMQLMFRSDDLEKTYDTLNLIDTGDYLGVEGTVVETKTGEVTIQVTSFSILSKSLRPLPSTWQGIGDPEVRYRKRYLDMIISPDVKRILDARFLIEKEIRRYLQDVQNFTEVETPVLQPLYGGTNAKPFTTHMNALDSDFYLRIAPELYLKRLIIGGYERIFEIARNFRNEGIDQTHQPEFTMMEWYEAYADYNRVMDVAEGMIKHLVQKLYGKGQLQVGEHTVNVEDTWPRITMKDAVKQHLHVDIDKATDEQLQEELETRHIQLTGTFSRGKAIFALFDKTVPEKLIQPTWIIDYPKEVSPLSKEHRSNKEFVERFECYIGGKEMCDGWSEITDALEQRKRFEVEQKHMREGDEEAQPTDEEFLEAMEYGMPPLGGIGIGIDRLVMFLTNVWSIKEVIAFPTLRPLKKLKLTKPTKTSNESKFSIEQKVEEDFDGIFFSYVFIRNVTVHKMDQVLEDSKKSLYESKKTLTTDDIGKLRPIDSYRKLFKATGVDFHSKRPSPEALLRRIAQGKNLYTINTGVDAYNLSVIESAVGLGGFDADKIVGAVSLRYSKSGEQMHLLGDDAPTILEDGSLVYADEKHPITLHVNYRDIDETKITTETKNIILFADGAPGLTEEIVNAALLKGAEYIQKYCGGTISNVTTVR